MFYLHRMHGDGLELLFFWKNREPLTWSP